MTRHLVIGAGEVGTALANVMDCDLRDVAPHTGFYSVIHIAFPWSNRFVRNVYAYAGLHTARAVVVHSTVPVGTCDPHGWTHSPVRGRHPNLVESLRVFPKHFGGPQATQLAEAWSDAVDGEHVVHSHAATTEAAKLWELVTYGVEIAMEKRIWSWCEREGLDFDEVYGEFGSSHNYGWEKIDPRFVKRLINHEPGPIGGHCVTQNAPLLGEKWVQEMLEPHSPEGVW